MNDALALGGFLLASYAAAASGAIFRPGEWYFEQLRKPSWNPPPWLFGPVWSVFYTVMAVAAWLVWREAGWSGAGAVALSVFLGHLIVNFAWSWLFFGLQRPDLALIEIFVLWGSVLACVLLFWPISTLAGALMVPYLAWVGFAGFLNWTLLRLNPGEQRLWAARAR